MFFPLQIQNLATFTTPEMMIKIDRLSIENRKVGEMNLHSASRGVSIVER